MKDVQANLRVDERVIVTARVNPAAVVLSVLLLAFGAAGIFLGLGPDAGWFRILAIIVAVFGLWLTVKTVLQLIGTQLIVTDQRIFGDAALPQRKSMTLALSDVDSVDAHSDILGSIFGYGTVVVNATGKGNLRVAFTPITKASQVAKEIRAQMALPTVKATAERSAH